MLDHEWQGYGHTSVLQWRTHSIHMPSRMFIHIYLVHLDELGHMSVIFEGIASAPTHHFQPQQPGYQQLLSRRILCCVQVTCWWTHCMLVHCRFPYQHWDSTNEYWLLCFCVHSFSLHTPFVAISTRFFNRYRGLLLGYVMSCGCTVLLQGSTNMLPRMFYHHFWQLGPCQQLVLTSGPIYLEFVGLASVHHSRPFQVCFCVWSFSLHTPPFVAISTRFFMDIEAYF